MFNFKVEQSDPGRVISTLGEFNVIKVIFDTKIYIMITDKDKKVVQETCYDV